jgi:hypothetical protein
MTQAQTLLLGDVKGTQSLLRDSSPEAMAVLESRLSGLHQAFARVVLLNLDRSRTMHGYCFSDSVFVRWDDADDGVRTAPGFALSLWREVERSGLHFRAFIDRSLVVPVKDDVGRAIEGSVGRYHHVVPVSMATWSVFLAEGSHFPRGVFVGSTIAEDVRRCGTAVGVRGFEAGPFRFYQIIDGGPSPAR